MQFNPHLMKPTKANRKSTPFSITFLKISNGKLQLFILQGTWAVLNFYKVEIIIMISGNNQ